MTISLTKQAFRGQSFQQQTVRIITSEMQADFSIFATKLITRTSWSTRNPINLSGDLFAYECFVYMVGQSRYFAASFQFSYQQEFY